MITITDAYRTLLKTIPEFRVTYDGFRKRVLKVKPNAGKLGLSETEFESLKTMYSATLRFKRFNKIKTSNKHKLQMELRNKGLKLVSGKDLIIYCSLHDAMSQSTLRQRSKDLFGTFSTNQMFTLEQIEAILFCNTNS